MKFHARLAILALLLAMALGYGEGRAAEDNFFGKQDASEAGLLGIIYDFKQTQQRQATGINAGGYPAIVYEFINSGWDESILNRYFRCARPLYTTQIFVPQMGADEAPKAFGVQDVVKPSAWVACYKGQVSPPESGRYRFVGCSDDLIAVAVDGKTVLAHAMFGIPMWHSPDKPGPQAANNRLVFGDWLDLRKDQPVDIDIIIGERPGGYFNAFLLYQKEDTNYPEDAHGNIRLPIFQLAPHEMPTLTEKEAPPFSIAAKMWKGY